MRRVRWQRAIEAFGKEALPLVHHAVASIVCFVEGMVLACDGSPVWSVGGAGG
jgi:hypothetical protein